MLFFVNSFFFSFKITLWYACWSRPAIGILHFACRRLESRRERLVKKYFVTRGCKGWGVVRKASFAFLGSNGASCDMIDSFCQLLRGSGREYRLFL